MDAYDPATVFSSIDHAGRYAYVNQPQIAQWNLARLAEALLPLIDDDVDSAVAAATEVLHAFPDRFREHLSAGMRAKLGLGDEARDGHAELADDLLALMHSAQVDFTSGFRPLSAGVRGDRAPARPSFGDRPSVWWGKRG